MIFSPGTYAAKVTAHAITETKSGDPQAAVTFEFEVGEGKRKITWFGSFKDKALPFTLKGLLACGLKGNNPAGPLEIGRGVSIVIETETDQQGKEQSRVRWVNAAGGLRNVVPQQSAISKLAALEGAVMAARVDNGISDDDDSIPF